MRRATWLLFALVLVVASCAERTTDAGSPLTSETVSGERAQDMLVFAPDAEGPWPVIVAYHGVDGTGRDMAEIATRLAREGAVVFVPTYRSDITTQKGAEDAAIDAECGYRLARSIAAEHGGDLDQPVTFVGWSLGASVALGIGLTEEIDPTGTFVSCFGQVPRPDIIVAISGCHYEGGQLDLVDTETWGNKEADVILIAGTEDITCASSESDKAADEMRSAGYRVDLLKLDGANHFAPVFHDLRDGRLVAAANDAAGERTVQVIMDAIASAQNRA